MNSFWLCWEEDVQLSSYLSGYPVALTPFVEKTILSPLICHGAHVKNHLTVSVLGHFWYLNYVPLIYMPILLTAPVEFCPVEQTKQMGQWEWY